MIFRHVDAKALDPFGDMLAVVNRWAFEHVAWDWQEHVVFRSQSDVIFEEFVVPGDELVITFGFSFARLYRECDHVVAEANLGREVIFLLGYDLIIFDIVTEGRERLTLSFPRMSSAAVNDSKNESVLAVFGKIILENLLDWEVEFTRTLIRVPIRHNIRLLIRENDALARVYAAN